MNLTWHIVKKDLRALKWPFLLWALVIVAKLAVGVMLLTADGTEEAEWFTRMSGLSQVLASFECVNFVLAAAVIQQDLLVGTRAFWVTRPISGGRLLRAKLLTLLLVFGLLPLIVTLPWWLGCGFGLREIGWAVVETSTIHLVCVLLGILWAVVTDGFGRFLMWTLVTLFAVPTLTGTITYYLWRGRARWDSDLLVERWAVGSVFAIVAILVVVAHQYLTRRTVRSIGLIAAATSVVIAIGVFWPWRIKLDERLYERLMAMEANSWPASAEPPGLNFAIAAAQLDLKPDGKGGTQVSFARIKYRVDGLKDSQVLMPYWAEHTWRWADGSEQKGTTWSRSGMGEIVAEKALGVAMKNATEGLYADTVSVVASAKGPGVGTKLQTQATAFTLPARLQLMRFDSATLVPLQAGSRDLEEGVGTRVAHVEKIGHELHVHFIRHQPALWIDQRGHWYPPVKQFTQYLLVNRKTQGVNRGMKVDLRSTRIGSVNISWHEAVYSAGKTPPGRHRAMLDDINALNDAELMKVTFVEQARFTHVLAADPLTFAADFSKFEPVNP